MKILFEFDERKCSACGACAVACMDQNDIETDEGQQPYRKVYTCENGAERVSMSISCLHCADAPCVAVCPANCLRKDEKTGLTCYDTTFCIGCHACAVACPYGAPSFRANGEKPDREKMEKCHGCLSRIEVGLTPACVHSCPTGALIWRWAEDDAVNRLGELYENWSAVR